VHVTPTVTKAAAGAVEHLPFAIVGGLPTALQQLSKQGVWIVGLDQDGSTGLWDLPAADGPIALVLGAEGSGLSRLVRQRCDEIASIPLKGALGSLNVSVAGALGASKSPAHAPPSSRPAPRSLPVLPVSARFCRLRATFLAMNAG
jgi:23S rRNA (guanosine2251-2'-O)-methyltransferase